MELDSLKYVWRTLEATPAPDRSPDEIRALLQRRSGGIVNRMRRNLTGELILIAATYTPAIVFYFLDFEGRLSAIAWLFILLLAMTENYPALPGSLTCSWPSLPCISIKRTGS